MKDKLKFALIFTAITLAAVVADRYIGYGIPKAKAAPVATPVVGYTNDAVVKLNSYQTALTLVYLKPLRYCTVILAVGSQQSSAISCILVEKEK